MPRKQPNLNIFAKTEPAAIHPDSPQDDKKKTPLAVGLRLSERAELERIAAELGVTRHALLAYAVRDFIRRYNAGERPETKQKTILGGE